MADARTAFLITVSPSHEGGFQNNPHDHANWSSGQIGVGTLIGTKYGITPADMPGVDIRNITPEQAVAYYIEHYWKSLYTQISSQAVANKLADLGVLFGVGTAVKMLQRALGLMEDASFGPQTLAAVNAADPNALLGKFKAVFIARAEAIGAANPNEAEDVRGWKTRIES